jgi:hypothetical protein
MAEQTKITALDNGPYLVKGSFVLLDAEGTTSSEPSGRPWRCAAAESRRPSPSATARIRGSGFVRRRGMFERR